MSLFDELGRHAELPFEQARMLPLAAYESDRLLEREIVELFGRDWLCVGRAIDIPQVGNFFTAEIPSSTGGDRKLIVMRSEDGEIRAFDNICVHRGARLLVGCGTEARITCPYHAWVYRTDGSLVGGPYLAGSVESDGRPFDASNHRLAELRVEVWHGFVFVNQNGQAGPLADRLTGLDHVVARAHTVHEQRQVQRRGAARHRHRARPSRERCEVGLEPVELRSDRSDPPAVEGTQQAPRLEDHRLGACPKGGGEPADERLLGEDRLAPEVGDGRRREHPDPGERRERDAKKESVLALHLVSGRRAGRASRNA